MTLGHLPYHLEEKKPWFKYLFQDHKNYIFSSKC